MKKTASIIFAVICIIAFASSAFAAEGGPKVNMFAGQIVSIDTANKTVTLKEDTKGTFTSTFTDKTRILQNNKPKAISDIKLGDIAAVIYDQVDGKNVARSISIFASAPLAPQK